MPVHKNVIKLELKERSAGKSSRSPGGKDKQSMTRPSGMSVTNEDRSAISRDDLLRPTMNVNERSLQNIMIKEEE